MNLVTMVAAKKDEKLISNTIPTKSFLHIALTNHLLSSSMTKVLTKIKNKETREECCYFNIDKMLSHQPSLPFSKDGNGGGFHMRFLNDDENPAFTIIQYDKDKSFKYITRLYLYCVRYQICCDN